MRTLDVPKKSGYSLKTTSAEGPRVLARRHVHAQGKTRCMFEIRLVGPGADPAFVRNFAARQLESYAEFAVSKVAAAVSEEDCEQEGVYFIVALKQSTGELVGGLRIHVARPGLLLPVERALPTVGRLRVLLPLYRARGLAEMSGVWVQATLRGSGLSGVMTRAGIAVMPLLQVRHVIAFTHHHVLRFWTPCGFAVDRRFGTHAYPDARYESSLIWLDPLALTHATPTQRAMILKMREAMTNGETIEWAPETGEKTVPPRPSASASSNQLVEMASS